MAVHIGGPTARKVLFDNKDHTLGCAFHYINGEPSACFFMPYKRGVDGRGFGAYVLGLSRAYTVADERAICDIAFRAAKQIGMDPRSRDDLHRIRDFLYSMLVELVSMEPEPAELQAPTPQFDIQREGNRIIMTSDRLH